jgi:hypothetical protein
MKAAIALLADYSIQNFVRRMVFEMSRITGPPLQFLIPTDLTVLASRLKSLRHASNSASVLRSP